MVIPKTGKPTSTQRVFLAEIGSIVVEMRHLSALTHDRQYKKAMESLYSALFSLDTLDGIFPDSISFWKHCSLLSLTIIIIDYHYYQLSSLSIIIIKSWTLNSTSIVVQVPLQVKIIPSQKQLDHFIKHSLVLMFRAISKIWYIL